MNRRKFLQLLGITGGAATPVSMGARKAVAASGARVEPDRNAVGVLHDSTLCIGCRRCEAACARVNNLPPPKDLGDAAVFDAKRRPEVDAYTVVNRYDRNAGKPIFRKMQCNHCLEPACASACFVRAFKKTPEGPVVYDPSLCVGCRYCMIACPFTIPAYDYHKVLNPLVHKCTLCAPRLAEGKLPGCVEICPTGALVFGKRTELLDLARERIRKTPGLYEDHIYGETEVGGTSWLYLSPVPHAELGQPELDTTSIPELTSGALGAVPMVAALWPVLLTGAYAISKRRDRIAAEEEAAAVAKAVSEAESKAAEELKKALAKAAKEKESALAKAAQEKDAAVAKALAEAEAKAAKTAATEAAAHEPDGKGER